MDITPEFIERVRSEGTEADQRALIKYFSDPYYTFRPFADDAKNFSQQTAFVNDHRNQNMICVLGGSGSGKSECGAYKVAKFLRTTPPPDDLCIFFVCSEDLEITTTLWVEKLRHYFDPSTIQQIDWYRKNSEQPNQVIFNPHKNGNRWKLVFKAASQGKKSFAGYNNVAGVWMDEPISLPLVDELWQRVRKYDFKGTVFWTLTPLDPYPDLEAIFNDQLSHPLWTFYRFNARANTTIKNRSALDSTPEDMRQTREIGAFCNMTGAVFKEWRQDHIFPHARINELFPDMARWQHYRIIDFGYEHETACLWIAYDRIKDRAVVYHEWSEAHLLIAEKVDRLKREVAWSEDERHFTFADTADAQQRAEFSYLGLSTSNARKEPVSMSIEATRKRMMIAADGLPRLLVSDSCRKLIRQIKGYRWAPAAKSVSNPKPTAQKPVKYDDDLVDCLRMYCYTTEPGDLKAWNVVERKH